MCRPSSRGIAYLAASNFLARGLMLTASFVASIFTYEMIYAAHIETQTILFFQSVYMIPVFGLGCLVYMGIETSSFSLVLYPTLSLLLVILIRYGAELSLIIIHWEYYAMSKAPTVLFDLFVDLVFISILLSYVYFCLTGVEDEIPQRLKESSSPPPDYIPLPKDILLINNTPTGEAQPGSSSNAPSSSGGNVASEKTVIPRFQYPRRKQPSEQEERPAKSGSRPSSFISLTLSSLQEEAVAKILDNPPPRLSMEKEKEQTNNEAVSNGKSVDDGDGTLIDESPHDQPEMIPTALISDFFKTTAV